LGFEFSDDLMLPVEGDDHRQHKYGADDHKYPDVDFLIRQMGKLPKPYHYGHAKIEELIHHIVWFNRYKLIQFV